MDRGRLDAHITGNWGEDQFREDEAAYCPTCESQPCECERRGLVPGSRPEEEAVWFEHWRLEEVMGEGEQDA